MTTFGTSTALLRAPALQSPSLLPAKIHHQLTRYPSLLVLYQANTNASESTPILSVNNLQQICTIFSKQFASATSVSAPTAQSKDYLPPTPVAFNPDPTYTPLSPATPNLNQQVLSEQRLWLP